MSEINTIEGNFVGGEGRFALVVGRWNSFVVEHLLEGAIDTLRRHGVTDEQMTIVRAPGAFEIPLVCQKVAEKGDVDAIIALGAVIRGGTPHFEYVSGECTKGISQVSMNTGVPVAFGVLTVDTIEQAIERSGTKAGNKGEEAALSALEMVSLITPDRRVSKSGHNTLAAERRKARHYGMQALYQWHMAGASLADIEAEFRGEYDFSRVDLEYFQALLHGVPACVDELEDTLTPLLDRDMNDLDPIERTLLRMGTFELAQRIDVPYKVVINEAVSLAKKFGATDGHKYINGVLDKVARQLRTVEIGAATGTDTGTATGTDTDTGSNSTG